MIVTQQQQQKKNMKLFRQTTIHSFMHIYSMQLCDLHTETHTHTLSINHYIILEQQQKQPRQNGNNDSCSRIKIIWNKNEIIMIIV